MKMTTRKWLGIAHNLQGIMQQEVQVDLPIKEYFSNGIYAREMTVPEGVVFVGETHLYENISVISKGTIRIATEDGIVEMTAPHTFIAPAGTKRVGIAITETVWTVFHATTLTNTDDIRNHFVTSDNLLER
jgi:hypothetical protein